ncbi:hypothetical protein AYI70_g4564 [Smittium culicis]|uniref:Uncharacterized protein n=1 Tax=Smittium culicis TaxID=133412 RepID=A0A1R1XYK0_9FUNG|nr:hypothetical protein AYI70_g4564 [Smittium culicis]
MQRFEWPFCVPPTTRYFAELTHLLDLLNCFCTNELDIFASVLFEINTPMDLADFFNEFAAGFELPNARRNTQELTLNIPFACSIIY